MPSPIMQRRIDYFALGLVQGMIASGEPFGAFHEKGIPTEQRPQAFAQWIYEMAAILDAEAENHGN